MPAEHAEIASIWYFSGAPAANVTFRYNVFTHAEGTGGLIMTGDGLYVYGNVFYRPAGDTWQHGNGLIGTWTVDTLTNVKVYNNTFINSQTGYPVLGESFTSPTTGNEARNNLFYLSQRIGNGNGLFPTHSHNHYVDSGFLTETAQTTGTGDPFTNYTALDFSLKAATVAGFTLSAPYATDMLGNTLGSDGTWDRGAIEFGGTPATAPSAPTSLSVN